MTHNQICQIWPSNKDKSDKYKRRLIGMEYYMDAMENHGLIYINNLILIQLI